MSLTDDTADAIILRWPKAQQAVAPKAKPTCRERLGWVAFIAWLIRLMVECLGWIAVLGFLTTWL